jgi:hypothetical protein
MFPLKDENPTTRKPFVTLVLIALNVAVFFLVQPAEHKCLTQTGRHWDPRFGGTEDVEQGHTPTWYQGP